MNIPVSRVGAGSGPGTCRQAGGVVFVRVHALSCLVVGLLCLLVGLLIGYGAVVDGGWGQALAAVALVAMAVCLFAGAVALKRRYGWFG